MQRILERQRWFFLQISGRRRIGKTALIQEALKGAGIAKTLYVQIPDSDPAGVVAACNGYLETFSWLHHLDITFPSLIPLCNYLILKNIIV